MPEQGLAWLKRDDLLNFEEVERLLEIFSSLGVRKLRFTGGEPFLRRDFTHFLKRICERDLFESISITTNGVLTAPHVPLLKSLRIHSVNLSLDTLDAHRFETITRRNELSRVMNTLHALIEHDIPTKINAVIMEGVNEEDLIPLALLSKEYPVDVRFIEEMPFNGRDDRHAVKWNCRGLLAALEAGLGTLHRLPDKQASTSENYSIPGHQGHVGIIAAWTRSFCGSCNRVRLTPAGQMKTCLYGNHDLDLRAMLRNGTPASEIAVNIEKAIEKKAIDGHHAQALRAPATESMATIGG
jgi:cyclic pyranopterin phosphate synthase